MFNSSSENPKRGTIQNRMGTNSMIMTGNPMAAIVYEWISLSIA
jgi:hypothetical protein